MAIASIPAPSPDPLRLRRRLGLQGLGFALLLLTAFAAAVYWGIAGERQENLRTETRQLAATAAAQLPLISHEFSEDGNARKFSNDHEVVALPLGQSQRVRWLDARGRLLMQQGELTLPPATPTTQPGWQRWSGGISLWQPVFTRPRRGEGDRPRLAGFVQVGLSTQPAEQELARLRRGMLLGGIAAVMVALVVGRRMLRTTFLPLQRQVRALERFTADASHELRHPLTLLRTWVATDPLAPSPLLQRIDGLAVQMAQLLNDLLFLARQDQGVSEGALPLGGWRPFDLLELLDDLIASCTHQAQTAGVRLALEVPDGLGAVPLRGQPEHLQRLFTNLLLNALRFSPPGGTVTLRLALSPGRVRVEVIDQGPGIAPEHRQAVFERFWRAVPGPTGDTPNDGSGHSGLGLPIARAIARRHGGELGLSAANPGQCVLAVDLPRG